VGVVDDDYGFSVNEPGENAQDTGAAKAARRAVDENEVERVRRLPGVPGRDYERERKGDDDYEQRSRRESEM
jgi:hypothetical protein